MEKLNVQFYEKVPDEKVRFVVIATNTNINGYGQSIENAIPLKCREVIVNKERTHYRWLKEN